MSKHFGGSSFDKYRNSSNRVRTSLLLKKQEKHIKRLHKALKCLEAENGRLKSNNSDLAKSLQQERERNSLLLSAKLEVDANYHNMLVKHVSTLDELETWRSRMVCTDKMLKNDVVMTLVKLSDEITKLKCKTSEYLFAPPLNRATVNFERHSMPHSQTSDTPNRQAAVNPMIKGHTIHQPKVSLRRISVPEPQMTSIMFNNGCKRRVQAFDHQLNIPSPIQEEPEESGRIRKQSRLQIIMHKDRHSAANKRFNFQSGMQTLSEDVGNASSHSDNAHTAEDGSNQLGPNILVPLLNIELLEQSQQILEEEPSVVADVSNYHPTHDSSSSSSNEIENSGQDEPEFNGFEEYDNAQTAKNNISSIMPLIENRPHDQSSALNNTVLLQMNQSHSLESSFQRPEISSVHDRNSILTKNNEPTTNSDLEISLKKDASIFDSFEEEKRKSAILLPKNFARSRKRFYPSCSSNEILDGSIEHPLIPVASSSIAEPMECEVVSSTFVTSSVQNLEAVENSSAVESSNDSDFIIPATVTNRRRKACRYSFVMPECSTASGDNTSVSMDGTSNSVESTTRRRKKVIKPKVSKNSNSFPVNSFVMPELSTASEDNTGIRTDDASSSVELTTRRLKRKPKVYKDSNSFPVNSFEVTGESGNTSREAPPQRPRRATVLPKVYKEPNLSTKLRRETQ